MHTNRSTLHLLYFLILICLMSNCSWTPRVETSIYEGPQGSISLITVSEESFEANHPVTLQTDTIAHILRGLQIREGNRLLQKIFSGEAHHQQVFTEEQIEILTPPLQKAFSQVTPEEHITIQTPDNREIGIHSLKGTMYVQGDDLYVTLKFGTHSSHDSTKSTVKGVRPNREGRGMPVVAFSPQEALRKDKPSHWFLGGEKKNHLVINVPLLASLHRQHPTTAVEPQREKSVSVPTSSKKTEQTKPKDTDSPGTSSQTQTSSQTSETSDTQRLLEEIKSLRKELADQKEAIEQLKQGDRGNH